MNPLRMKNALAWLLALFIHLVFTGEAASQIPVMPGACPPGSINLTTPNDSHPHYTFPAVPRTSSHPGLDVAITVWRIPCGSTGYFGLWVRLADAGMAPGAVRPKISVYQDGGYLGWFGTEVRRTATGNSYFYGSGFQWGSNFFQTGSIQGQSQTEALIAMTTFLQPARGFTLRVRDTLDWPDSVPDLVYEVPGVEGSPAPGQVPADITGLWMNADEPGWGVMIDRNAQGIVFATLLTYDDEGKTAWIPMTRGELNARGEVVGDTLSVSGQPFAQASSPTEFQYAINGRAALTFASSSSAKIHWTSNGRTLLGNLTRLKVRDIHGNECTGTPAVHSIEGLSGWGAQFQGANTGPGCGVHATLLTYDDAGKPIWVFAALFSDTGAADERGAFAVSGKVYRPRGSPFGLAYERSQFVLGEPVGEWQSRRAGESEVRRQMNLRMLGVERALIATPFLF